MGGKDRGGKCQFDRAEASGLIYTGLWRCVIDSLVGSSHARARVYKYVTCTEREKINFL